MTDAEVLRFRVLDLIREREGQSAKALAGKIGLPPHEAATFDQLAAEGLIDNFTGWALTPAGRAEYNSFRKCRVPGCAYVEKRGSRQGDFVEGRFVCPAHATKIGQRAAREAFNRERASHGN